MLAWAGACRFSSDRRDLAACRVTQDCTPGTVCLQGVCSRPIDAAVELPTDVTAETGETEPDGAPVDAPPDGAPNIVVLAPTPNQLLPAGAFAFDATVVTPGVGVSFFWKYMNATCGGVFCNKCPQFGVPKTGGSYKVTKVVTASGTGDLCGGKALADWAHGDWEFVVQVGVDKVTVPFKVP